MDTKNELNNQPVPVTEAHTDVPNNSNSTLYQSIHAEPLLTTVLCYAACLLTAAKALAYLKQNYSLTDAVLRIGFSESFVGQQTRHRRDHGKYLTLIKAVTLLHQYQRQTKQVDVNGQSLEYLEVTRRDIAVANQIADWALGRSTLTHNTIAGYMIAERTRSRSFLSVVLAPGSSMTRMARWSQSAPTCIRSEGSRSQRQRNATGIDQSYYLFLGSKNENWELSNGLLGESLILIPVSS